MNKEVAVTTPPDYHHRARFILCCRSALVTLCCVLLLACTRPPDDVLRFGLASAPISFDPRFTTDATSARINRLLYRQLVEFDDNLRPVPGLATWEQVTPTHYRFRLRSDRSQFTDGTPVTAQDVKATYDSILAPVTASPHRGTFAMIEAIEIVDNDAIDFRLRKPDPLFPGRLVIGIMPASRLQQSWGFAKQPVGSGGFDFVAWPEESRVVLRRRNDGLSVEFDVVRDPTVRVLKLLRGEIDMAQNDLPPELIDYARKQERLQVLSHRGSNFSYLGFNLLDKTVGALALREAIAYGIDRAAIIRYLLGAAARPASALLPPDHWAGDPDLTPFPYDVARAKQLLQQAGYSEQNRPQIIYKTSSDPFRIRVATVIQQQLAQLGIDVQLQTYDWGTFYGDIKAGRFQMFSLSWVGVKTPDIFHYAFHSEAVPPDGANRGRYRDAVTDQLIERADSESDPVQQAADYRKLQEQLNETLPYVPLWYEDHVVVANKQLKDYRLNLDGNYDGLLTVHRQQRIRNE